MASERTLSTLPVRLWHDDIRPPPEGWLWARTNGEAQEILSSREVAEISLDHDMGLHDLNPDGEHTINLRGFSEDNGLKLVEWMIAHDKVPPKVTIHSWNPEGAKRMYLKLNEHGYDCVYEAYTPR